MGGPLPAEDLLVPSRFPSIQAAMNAAHPFDRVRVAPGVYAECLMFPGIPLVVESERGALETVIDARGAGPVVTFHDGDSVFTLLRGFTLTGGRVEADQALGAGILCALGSPVIAENIVVDNRTAGQTYSLGAGLYTRGQPVVVDNEFRTNLAEGIEQGTHLGGGGIWATGGWFLGNRILGNTVIGNRNVSDKVLLGRGGGVYLAGNALFVKNEVTGNSVGYFCLIATGGGLYLEGQPVVALNFIHANSARATVGRGGGIYCGGGLSAPVVFSNAITENIAHVELDHGVNPALGGGIYVHDGGRPDIAYNTVHRNRVSGDIGYGAGLAAEASSSPRIRGCVFWDNVLWREGCAISVASFLGVKQDAVHHCLVGDGQFVGVNHNFRADPGFVDLFHLGPDSPCIDAGEVAPACPLALDIDEAARETDGRSLGQPRIDVGADEYAALSRQGIARLVPGSRAWLRLEAPPAAGKPYLLAASLGIQGIPLPPPDLRRFPLDLDHLFQLSLGRDAPPFLGFGGVLDEEGEAPAALKIPPVYTLAGVTVYVAGLVYDGSGVVVVTNAVALTIERESP